MQTEPLVLAVDDEPGILRLIKLELASQRFRVMTAESGEEALRVEEEHHPDVVLLDTMMPGMDGIEVMRLLRVRGDVPIIMLTALAADSDKVRALEAGADDYLAKPFSPFELSARVRAVLRRCTMAPTGVRELRLGPCVIDLHRRVVTRDGAIVVLTRTEWLLLQHLAAHPGRIILNSELLSRVWGPEYRDDLQYLRVWVSRLRKKIETDPANPSIIKTFQGAGYMLASPAAGPSTDALRDPATARDRLAG